MVHFVKSVAGGLINSVNIKAKMSWQQLGLGYNTSSSKGSGKGGSGVRGGGDRMGNHMAAAA
jgi:hypothetical protein